MAGSTIREGRFKCVEFKDTEECAEMGEDEVSYLGLGRELRQLCHLGSAMVPDIVLLARVQLPQNVAPLPEEGHGIFPNLAGAHKAAVHRTHHTLLVWQPKGLRKLTAHTAVELGQGGSKVASIRLDKVVLADPSVDVEGRQLFLRKFTLARQGRFQRLVHQLVAVHRLSLRLFPLAEITHVRGRRRDGELANGVAKVHDGGGEGEVWALRDALPERARELEDRSEELIQRLESWARVQAHREHLLHCKFRMLGRGLPFLFHEKPVDVLVDVIEEALGRLAVVVFVTCAVGAAAGSQGTRCGEGRRVSRGGKHSVTLRIKQGGHVVRIKSRAPKSSVSDQLSVIFAGPFTYSHSAAVV